VNWGLIDRFEKSGARVPMDLDNCPNYRFASMGLVVHVGFFLTFSVFSVTLWLTLRICSIAANTSVENSTAPVLACCRRVPGPFVCAATGVQFMIVKRSRTG
jgi:hypothetical protein